MITLIIIIIFAVLGYLGYLVYSKENFFLMPPTSDTGMPIPNWSFSPERPIVTGLCKFNDNAIGNIINGKCVVINKGKIHQVDNPAYLDYSDSFIFTNISPYNPVKNVCKVGDKFGTIENYQCVYINDQNKIEKRGDFQNLGIF